MHNIFCLKNAHQFIELAHRKFLVISFQKLDFTIQSIPRIVSRRHPREKPMELCWNSLLFVQLTVMNKRRINIILGHPSCSAERAKYHRTHTRTAE